MEAINIKNILNDRIKLSYMIAVSVLAVFAYILLIKIDGGNFARLGSAIREVNDNLIILQDISGYKAYLSEFDSNFVTDKDANWLIDILTKFAADTDVRIDSLKPVSGAAISDYRVRSINAEGEASYPNLLRFIRKIENYKLGLFVERLSMTKGSVEGYGRQDTGPGVFGQAMPAIGKPSASVDETGLIRFELVLSFLSANR